MDSLNFSETHPPSISRMLPQPATCTSCSSLDAWHEAQRAATAYHSGQRSAHMLYHYAGGCYCHTGYSVTQRYRSTTVWVQL